MLLDELHVHHLVGRLKGALNQELSLITAIILTRLATSVNIHVGVGDNRVRHMLVPLYDYTRAMVKYSSDYVEERQALMYTHL